MERLRRWRLVLWRRYGIDVPALVISGLVILFGLLLLFRT
jgi:hypothetical protein